MSFPGDASDGYTLYSTTIEDDVSDNSTGIVSVSSGTVVKEGSTVDLMMRIFEQLNITYTVHPVSDKSTSRYSSSYTQCVHEVALNETDLCIGAFWTTSERLLLTSFTTAMYQGIDVYVVLLYVISHFFNDSLIFIVFVTYF